MCTGEASGFGGSGVDALAALGAGAFGTALESATLEGAETRVEEFSPPQAKRTCAPTPKSPRLVDPRRKKPRPCGFRATEPSTFGAAGGVLTRALRMSYVVLARKWRPQRFQDLVGQEHVCRTLSNAIESGRVAHAFLFTGVRGVGKTTSARILAKALNCLRPPGSVPAGTDPGPTATPCLACAACAEITAGTDVDVREIDGASYNGVDEVRKLQDSLIYRPTRDRSKIFIIDEVHMLSQSAWNAFLKTLEEPPPHVKFIFATTESHKIPVTILSRVQRFDFRLISARQIGERLKYVLSEEGIASDEAAVSIIAREAAGSMRDAMSLLDQVIAWNPGELVGDDVARVLGVASRQALFDVASSLVRGDAAQCLSLTGSLAQQGFDMTHVARDLLSTLRDLVVAKLCKDPAELLDLPDVERRDLTALAKDAEGDDLLRLHHGFSEGFDLVARGTDPRSALEMLLVRLARRPPLIPIDELLGRLATLEKRLGGPSDPRPGGRRPEADPPRRPQAVPSHSAPPQSAPPSSPAERPRSRDERSSAPAREATKAVAAEAADEPPPGLHAVPMPEPRPAAPSRPIVSRVRPPMPEGDYARRLEALGRIVDALRPERPELAAFVEHACPLELGDSVLVLGVPKGSMFGAEISSKSALDALTRATTKELGREARVNVQLDAADAEGLMTLAELALIAREASEAKAVQRAKAHPRIHEAVEILGARLKELKLGGS
jgi:DNA polymerase III subunit gamma/tau